MQRVQQDVRTAVKSEGEAWLHDSLVCLVCPFVSNKPELCFSTCRFICASTVERDPSSVRPATKASLSSLTYRSTTWSTRARSHTNARYGAGVPAGRSQASSAGCCCRLLMSAFAPSPPGLSQTFQQHQQPENSPAPSLGGEAVPLQTLPGKVHPVCPSQAPQAPALPRATAQMPPLPSPLHPPMQPAASPEGLLPGGGLSPWKPGGLRSRFLGGDAAC